MNVDDVVRRFDAKPVGAGHMARCPAHEDSTASLSINQKGDKILVKCFAGCDTESVLRAAGLTMKDLFVSSNGHKHVSPIIATYEYRDIDGVVQYRKPRTADKRFWFERPDGHGHWIRNMEGVERLLYRLQDLREQSEGSSSETFRVYIAEGEKDVDRLWSLGLPSTTNDSGASEDRQKPKWSDELTQQLKKIGVTAVACIPDNDDPGRAHMRAVARSCTATGIEARIVSLPDLPPKGDVSDYFDAAHTSAELIALCDAAGVYVPEAVPQVTTDETAAHRRVEFVCASEVPVVKMDWLWRARFARGAITMVEGGPERGKSTILIDMASRVSRGEPFPGETARRDPGNVVMLVAEDDLGATVVPRLIAADADLSRIFFLSLTRDEQGEIVPFHLSDDCERLRLKCEEISDVLLVIVDPLVSFLGSRRGRTLNTYNDMEVRKALGPLKELAESLRSSVAAIRHYRKNSGVNAMEAGGGSVAFAALVRIITAALPDPDDETMYFWAVAKNNLVKPSERPAIRYSIVSANTDPDIGCISWGDTVDRSANEILAAQVEADKDGGKVADAQDFLETFLADGAWKATKEILAAADAQGIKKSAIERAKTKLSIDVSRVNDKWGWQLAATKM